MQSAYFLHNFLPQLYSSMLFHYHSWPHLCCNIRQIHPPSISILAQLFTFSVYLKLSEAQFLTNFRNGVPQLWLWNCSFQDRRIDLSCHVNAWSFWLFHCCSALPQIPWLLMRLLNKGNKRRKRQLLPQCGKLQDLGGEYFSLTICDDLIFEHLAHADVTYSMESMPFHGFNRTTQQPLGAWGGGWS